MQPERTTGFEQSSGTAPAVAQHPGPLDIACHGLPLLTGWEPSAFEPFENLPRIDVRVTREPSISGRVDPYAAPSVVHVVLPTPAVRVRRFVVCDPQSAPPKKPAAGGIIPQRVALIQSATRTAVALDRPGTTRIQRPADLVKIEDRLRYLLEPPLENLLADQALSFPMTPFPYQLEGIAFLYPRTHAVLADEMGLGKTMQTVTAIRLLLHEGRLARVLLVCPKPLLTNWRREFHLWAPELSITLIEGDPATRHWLWQRERPGVMLANYELAVRDRDALPDRHRPFDLVVLDESQRIKNRHSATSQAVRRIARKRSWALTGTPMENHTDDLVGIFEFLLPGYLRSDMRPRRLGQAISDYVLRRTKDQVLSQLPPIVRRDAMLSLDPEQRRTYDLAENEGIIRLSRMGHSLTVRHVLELVLRLKQICNFDPATGNSAKLERLLIDLEECRASERKVIVFSQWVETLKRLSQALQSFQPLEYHGRIPANQRDAVIERFRRERRHRVLLISYGAGGVGLNLQFANDVFLFDRWWNPAVEDQAIHRAHRIGTDSPVIVTRLMAVETIEERISEILEQKRQLFQTVFSATKPGPRWGISAAELLEALGIKPPAGWSAEAA